jgi:hypothetical protein
MIILQESVELAIRYLLNIRRIKSIEEIPKNDDRHQDDDP